MERALPDSNTENIFADCSMPGHDAEAEEIMKGVESPRSEDAHAAARDSLIALAASTSDFSGGSSSIMRSNVSEEVQQGKEINETPAFESPSSSTSSSESTEIMKALEKEKGDEEETAKDSVDDAATSNQHLLYRQQQALHQQYIMAQQQFIVAQAALHHAAQTNAPGDEQQRAQHAMLTAALTQQSIIQQYQKQLAFVAEARKMEEAKTTEKNVDIPNLFGKYPLVIDSHSFSSSSSSPPVITAPDSSSADQNQETAKASSEDDQTKDISATTEQAVGATTNVIKSAENSHPKMAPDSASASEEACSSETPASIQQSEQQVRLMQMIMQHQHLRALQAQAIQAAQQQGRVTQPTQSTAHQINIAQQAQMMQQMAAVAVAAQQAGNALTPQQLFQYAQTQYMQQALASQQQNLATTVAAASTPQEQSSQNGEMKDGKPASIENDYENNDKCDAQQSNGTSGKKCRQDEGGSGEESTTAEPALQMTQIHALATHHAHAAAVACARRGGNKEEQTRDAHAAYQAVMQAQHHVQAAAAAAAAQASREEDMRKKRQRSNDGREGNSEAQGNVLSVLSSAQSDNGSFGGASTCNTDMKPNSSITSNNAITRGGNGNKHITTMNVPQKYPPNGARASNWTEQQDKKLRNLVTECGPREWKKIALMMECDVTDVQCLHRWNKVLKPGLKKGPWTAPEDAVVTTLVQTHGIGKIKWSQVAEKLPGRIGKQCRERWFNHLDPDISKNEWREDENEYLYNYQRQYGNKWSQIAKLMSGRTENGVKNRFNSSSYKKWAQKKGYELEGTCQRKKRKIEGTEETASFAHIDHISTTIPRSSELQVPAENVEASAPVQSASI